jgi:hypothetical protein
MKLAEFKTAGKGKNAVLVATVADQTGALDYELRIAGPTAGVKRIFSKTDFTVTIDTKRSAQDANTEVAKYTQAQTQEFAQLAKLEKTLDLHSIKRPAREPDPAKSVYVSLQRLRGEGTFWAFGFPYLLLTGWNIFVFPPPVLKLGATVAPLTGDQDIFLNSLFGPLLGSSAKGGIAPDTVVFSGPGMGLLRIRIFGFAGGLGNFGMAGISLP